MSTHESQSLFLTIIFLVEGFSPVLGLYIIAFGVDVKNWVLTIIKTSLPIMGIVYFTLGIIRSPTYSVNEQFLLYSITISIFLHFLQIKNPDKPANVLGITLIVTHLFSQFWEFPLFIMAHLGVPPFTYHGSIDQIYFLLVFYLGLRFTDKIIEKRDIIILAIPLIATTLTFISNPVAFQHMTPIWFLVRCLSCLCLGKFFLDRRVL